MNWVWRELEKVSILCSTLSTIVATSTIVASIILGVVVKDETVVEGSDVDVISAVVWIVVMGEKRALSCSCDDVDGDADDDGILSVVTFSSVFLWFFKQACLMDFLGYIEKDEYMNTKLWYFHI